MLRLEGLSCGYGLVEAASDVSFALPDGTMLALLGANGAGKTSTLMAIMGHLDIHGGRIEFDGSEITRRPARERAKMGIAIVPEGRQLFPDLTVDENLTVGGYVHPLARDRANRDRVFTLFPRLYERRSQVSGSLSGGEQQQLAIGRALMTEPRLLLVDELSLGLMPKVFDQCLDALVVLKNEGLSIVLVEQRTTQALEVADAACVMSSGRVAFSGSAAEARSNTAIVDRMLGLRDA
jgi:branched-chain amino acid transport system ATP-binding protein